MKNALLITAALIWGCGGLSHPASAGGMPAAAALDPARSQALYLNVIRQLHRDGKSHAALAYLDDFDTRHPADPRARLLRADCLLALDHLTEAEAHYQALVSGSERAAAHAGLGQVAAERGDWPGAVAAYERAVSASPVDAAYRNDLGYALYRAGAIERARFTLRQASELAPDNALIRNNLALALDPAHP